LKEGRLLVVIANHLGGKKSGGEAFQSAEKRGKNQQFEKGKRHKKKEELLIPMVQEKTKGGKGRGGK